MTDILIILLLIILNGFFSLAEVALISARKNRIEAMAKSGSRAKTNERPRPLSLYCASRNNHSGNPHGSFLGRRVCRTFRKRSFIARNE